MDTFLVLDRVGKQMQQRIYSQGIRTWQQFLATRIVKGISPRAKIAHDLRLRRVQQALREQDLPELILRYPGSEHWRLYTHFKERTLFLDIETSEYYGDVTVIGMWSLQMDEPITMVAGSNLDKERFLAVWARHDIIVTFNGRSFDIPVLERYFGVSLGKIHIDLRQLCQRIGLVGGLKAIELMVGIDRQNTCEDPVMYWQIWQATGNGEFLEKLIAYNRDDVVDLVPVLEYCLNNL